LNEAELDTIESIKLVPAWLDRLGFDEFNYKGHGTVRSVWISRLENQRLILIDNNHSFYCLLEQNGNEFALRQ
jgi:hypothetical protein